MRAARKARCALRPSTARRNSNLNSRFTGFKLSCGEQTTKQFSNRNKNAFFGIWTVNFSAARSSLRSYPFAQSRKAVRSCPTRMLTLEIAPRRLG